MEKYLNYLRVNNYSKNTIYAYKSALKDFFNYISNDLNNVEQILQYFSKFKMKYSPATLNFKKIVIINFLKFNKNKLFLKIQKLKFPRIQIDF
ncbi:hypothetical protein E7Y35_06590 [Spiroplasma sp. SV19]|nr:hypothetical protein E7Y35_06590 [Spiroplasma sp. SV19]